MPRRQNKLRIASKHGAHEAIGNFAILALALIVIVPIVAAVVSW